METLNTTTITPHEKAVQINLDRRFYGTFAEIGAGQEVARWFFRVGGASGTVAKTISAYDMGFSDPCRQGERYVSMPACRHARLRVQAPHRAPREKRGSTTSFFVFSTPFPREITSAPTSATAGSASNLQLQPEADPSEIIIHVNMLDKENLQQQEAASASSA